MGWEIASLLRRWDRGEGRVQGRTGCAFAPRNDGFLVFSAGVTISQYRPFAA